MPPHLTTELLGRHHDRRAFTCGAPSLDRYLKTQASQDVKRRQATVLVVCERPGASEILGYYTIASSSVLLTDVPSDLAKRLPYPQVPVTLVGRLAVASRYAGRGYGSYMLMDAAGRAMAPGAPASWALIVDPLDDSAAAWYGRFGFMRLEGSSDRLFLPLATIEAAVSDSLNG